MASCEKCWAEAGGDAERYHDIFTDPKRPDCTPEEQAGPYATECPKCGRKVIHQYAKVHMGPCFTVQRGTEHGG